MRRLAPRPLKVALEQATKQAAPAGALAKVQASWPALVGPVVAVEATPVSERDGVITVACSSSVWAQELELLAPELLPRVNAETAPATVRSLRFTVARGGAL